MEDVTTDKGTPTPKDTSAPADDVKNLKAEFNRKLSNLEENTQRLMAQLQTMTPPKKSDEPKKVSVFDDEEAYARQIEDRAEKRIEEKLSRQQAAQAKQQQTIAALVADFPELTDPGHDLTKKAVEIFESFSAEDKASPVAYRAAVREAAEELELKPKSKRKAKASDDESFSLGGRTKVSPAAKKDEIDPNTLVFAEAVGLKLTPEVKERLKGKHGRRSYTDWG